MDVVICCIALNEELYIDEWLDHHLNKIGFNKVYVYDNSDGNTLSGKNSQKVTVFHFPGKVKQVPAYNHFLENFRSHHDWCAFIDVDEFFVLKKHKTIQEYLEGFESPPEAIGVNWVLYGSDGQEKYDPRPVTQRFTKREPGVNQHIKTIVNLKGSRKVTFENCHFPQNIPITVHTSNGKTNWMFNTPFNNDGNDSVIQLNHYFCKSREEFMKKIERGRADITEKRTMREFF